MKAQIGTVWNNEGFVVGDLVEVEYEVPNSKNIDEINRVLIGKIVSCGNNLLKIDVSEKYNAQVETINLLLITGISSVGNAQKGGEGMQKEICDNCAHGEMNITTTQDVIFCGLDNKAHPPTDTCKKCVTFDCLNAVMDEQHRRCEVSKVEKWEKVLNLAQEYGFMKYASSGSTKDVALLIFVNEESK